MLKMVSRMKTRLNARQIIASLILSTETSTIHPSLEDVCLLALATLPSRASSSRTKKIVVMEARMAFSESSR